MEIRESAQDYLEAILVLEKEKLNVKSVDVASHMCVTKQSVHRAMKNLKEGGHILISDKGYITLSDSGRSIAEDTYMKHNILSNFFISLGVDKSIAYSDACKIEHDISDESFEAIKKLMSKK